MSTVKKKVPGGIFSLIQSARGSMLLTSLMVLAMICITMLATMQTLISAKQSAETTAVDTDFTALVSQVNSLLTREDSCRDAFGGPIGNWPNPSVPMENAQSFPSVIPLPQSLNLKIYYPPAGSGNVLAGGGSTFNRLMNIQVVLKLVSSPAPNFYQAELSITATKPTGLLGSATLTTTTPIPMSVQLQGANQIFSCSSQALAGGVGVNIPICTNGTALFNDSAGLRCVNVVCMKPHVAIGWNSDGSVQCSP